MHPALSIVLTVVLAIMSAHYFVLSMRLERVPIPDEAKEFTVRYPRSYFWLFWMFFLPISSVLLSLLLSQKTLWQTLLMCGVLLVIGIPFLLKGVVWKIVVRKSGLLYVSMLGVKRNIAYEDIEGVLVTPGKIVLRTQIGKFSFSAILPYKEAFLRILARHGIPVTRYMR